MNISDIKSSDVLFALALAGLYVLVVGGCVGYYLNTLLLVLSRERSRIAREYLGNEILFTPWVTVVLLSLLAWITCAYCQTILVGQGEKTALYCFAFLFFAFASAHSIVDHCKILLDKRDELMKISLLPMFVGRIVKTEVLNAASRSLRLTLQKSNGEELVVVARESDKGHTLDWVSGETIAVFYDPEEATLNVAKRVIRVKPAVTKVAPDKAWPSTV